MLPVLPTPARAPGPGRWTAWLALPLLALILSGCLGRSGPPRGVVLDALSLQIRLTQAAIAESLNLEPIGDPEVSRVRVEQQEALEIAGGPALRLNGRFDWRLAGDPIRVDTPFELFLQRGERGQSWRLARPAGVQDGEQQWISDPLPLRTRGRG